MNCLSNLISERFTPYLNHSKSQRIYTDCELSLIVIYIRSIYSQTQVDRLSTHNGDIGFEGAG